jgi:glycosyltransferase involved in cell wall biosynthesis
MAPSAPSHPASLPRISVITIVRNGERFVGQTIESVLKQRYANIEYIVIDGGSTDGTVDVIRSYEARIAKWVSERDEGIADAFNKGLSFATGDYLLFLNSDDALANTHVLEDVAGMMVENGFPALIYGDYNILKRNSGEFMYRGMVKLSPEGLVHGQVLPHPCLFTHRSYFDKYGRFDPRFRIAMDYEWLLRGALMERIVHVPLVVSNIRDGGISTLDRGKVVDEIVYALKKNNFIRSAVSEYKIRGYFFIRSFARNVLNVIGLYKLFFNLRNRLKNG